MAKRYLGGGGLLSGAEQTVDLYLAWLGGQRCFMPQAHKNQINQIKSNPGSIALEEEVRQETCILS